MRKTVCFRCAFLTECVAMSRFRLAVMMILVSCATSRAAAEPMSAERWMDALRAGKEYRCTEKSPSGNTLETAVHFSRLESGDPVTFITITQREFPASDRNKRWGYVWSGIVQRANSAPDIFELICTLHQQFEFGPSGKKEVSGFKQKDIKLHFDQTKTIAPSELETLSIYYYEIRSAEERLSGRSGKWTRMMGAWMECDKKEFKKQYGPVYLD